jgi:pullulanase
VFNYYKGLIALRKNHPAFRMPSTQMIQSHLSFLDTKNPDVIAYQISGNANGDSWKNILVIFNGNTADKRITIAKGNWILAADANAISESGIRNINASVVLLPATSAYILYQK